MEKYILDIEKVTYKYPDGYKAIKDISFKVKDGEKVGLIGANGAGKSTILQLIAGLYFCNEGKIVVDNMEVNKKTLKEIRKGLGFVFQESDNQLFMNTVYEDIAFGLRSNKVSEEDININITDILNKLSIDKLKDKEIYKLSGGQKKIASIAGILVMKPKIILMDEPTSSLDPKSRRTVINIINSINKTFIIATHDLDMILDCCEKVIILQDGKVIAEGKSQELLRDKEILEKANLELPLSFQR
ncbi:energy-coupling factor ABC transporter ATP-binding protein [Clostridium bornimense]|uniref:energy-coupling factor ABC transporter ATP-binding protein n=1 Tax=Clostridium bornimense TaxID=1216932 RepID=UPI001C119969|nr:ABC transporter ATP-binding protein [Clostridium bornimense]MBU5315708.1 energy-coupling factor ABC transporter ATP-binding protein [Clostridium bornimense]